MDAFVEMDDLGHEQVLFCRHHASGLRAIIAVHDTTLGPAIGGVRLFDYASTDEALRDVLRLARGMTYKAAVAGLDLGGGKAVILGDRSIKSEALFRAFGRHVASLGGRFITAEDMNTNVEDMNWIRRETRWVTGSGTSVGGSGDPSPVTAWGIYHGIRACLEVVFGSPDVAGRAVAIQGVGAVGWQLARYLHENGARLLISDINAARLAAARDAFGASVVEGAEFYRASCDVLAPCAIGGVLNPRTIKMIQAPIVAGGANNQLDDEVRDAEALAARGVTYVPDYVINAGGLISVAGELHGWTREKSLGDAAGIFTTVKRVLDKARASGGTTITASNQLAEERIAAVAAVRSLRV